MGHVVVASGSSPSAYIQGLHRKIDRGDPNASVDDDDTLESGPNVTIPQTGNDTRTSGM